MRRAAAAVAVALLACAGAGVSASDVAGAASARPRLTPVVVAPVSPFAPMGVVGTDDALHVLYELQLTNTQAVDAPVTRVEVRGIDPNRSVAVIEGAELTARLRRLDGTPVAEPVIAASSQLLLLVDLAFHGGDVPLAVQHRFTFGPTARTPQPRESNAARVDLNPAQASTIGPPVDGANWVVTNGCCSPLATHRSTILPTDAGLSVAERFAIDFRQMDEAGRFVVDDPNLLENYAGYGANVLSVAAGRVVSVVDTFVEQPPNTGPPPAATFGPDTNEGNSVVVDLGNGSYAFYGQLQAGSIIVREGDRVRRGQALARLGNSGNSMSPHLHFHLMTGESVVGSDGVPFALNRFGYSGQIDPGQLAQAGLQGVYGNNRFPVPVARARQLPLDLAILDFVASPGASGNPLA